MDPRNDDRFLIVSVDGGGIRGVVPAMLLQDLHRNEDLDFSRIDLFAGTSTGSLIAVGLATDLAIDTIVGVYRDAARCHQIFTPNDGSADSHEGRHGCVGRVMSVVEWLVRGHTSGVRGFLNRMLFPMYQPSGFEALVRGLTPDKTIGEVEKHHIFLPSLCIDTELDGHRSWRATAFHNMPAPDTDPEGFGGHPRAPLVDALVATSSAPVAFPPHEWEGKLFIDGGVVANNPSALALSAAVGAGLIGGRSGIPLERVYMLSLGTGANNTRYPPEGVAFPPPYGILGWMWPEARGPGEEAPALPLISALSDATMQAADYQVRMMLPAENYRRVELSLGDHHVPLSDCEGLPHLEARTERFIKSDAEWSDVREWVARHFS